MKLLNNIVFQNKTDVAIRSLAGEKTSIFSISAWGSQPARDSSQR